MMGYLLHKYKYLSLRKRTFVLKASCLLLTVVSPKHFFFKFFFIVIHSVLGQK